MLIMSSYSFDHKVFECCLVHCHNSVALLDEELNYTVDENKDDCWIANSFNMISVKMRMPVRMAPCY